MSIPSSLAMVVLERGQRFIERGSMLPQVQGCLFRGSGGGPGARDPASRTVKNVIE